MIPSWHSDFQAILEMFEKCRFQLDKFTISMVSFGFKFEVWSLLHTFQNEKQKFESLSKL